MSITLIPSAQDSCNSPGALFCIGGARELLLLRSSVQVRARSNTADGAVWYFFYNPLDGVCAPAALGAAAEVGIDLAHPRPSSGLRYSGPKLMVTERVARADDHDLVL